MLYKEDNFGVRQQGCSHAWLDERSTAGFTDGATVKVEALAICATEGPTHVTSVQIGVSLSAIAERRTRRAESHTEPRQSAGGY